MKRRLDRMWRSGVVTVIRTVAILGVSLICFASGAVTQDSPSRLEKINLEVRSAEQALETLTRREEELQQATRELSAQLKQLSVESNKLGKELQSVKAEILSLEKERVQTDQAIASRQKQFLSRIGAMYRFRSQEHSSLLLQLAGSGEDFSRHSLYLRKVGDYDQRVMKEMSALQQARSSQLDKLVKAMARQQATQKALALKQESLNLKQRRQRTVDAELRIERAKLEVEVARLKAQALRLETVVASLAGGEEADDDQRSTRAERSRDRPKPLEPFRGQGLARLKGKLKTPVEGKVLQGFGKGKVEGFADIVFHKGIEYSTAEKSNVEVVADGRVMHVGRLPGYGTVVIVDHGKRSYSLYGRLASVDVERGDTVSVGDVIGLTGAADERGRSFYFEIRQNGAPINPRQYLAARKAK